MSECHCPHLRMPFLTAHNSDRRRPSSDPQMPLRLERIAALLGPAYLDAQACIHVLGFAA